MSELSENEVYDKLDIEPDTIIPFESCEDALCRKQERLTQEDIADFLAYQGVNKILVNFGFEPYSSGQFQRIGGGSSRSDNLIPNYYNGHGRVKYGYTKGEDLAKFCVNTLENSVFIDRDDVLEWLKWSMKAVNEGYITRYSGSKRRYDIEAFLDITKGHMPEEGFKKDALENFSCEIKLDRALYGTSLDTDEGADVKYIGENGEDRPPKLKVQVKDVQWNFLVSDNEFKGPRRAEIYVGYKTHWPKEVLGQKLMSYIDVENKIFDEEPLEGIRVERRGWAWPYDFEFLPAGEKKKNKTAFNRNDNYYVYWTELRPMETFPFEDL